MAKYTFSKISIFSIDKEDDDDGNVSPFLESLVLDTGPVSVVTASLPLVPAMCASSLFLSREPLLSSKSVKQQGKEKVIVEEEAEAYGLNENAGDEDIIRDAMRDM
ncbi:hypothetical protein Fot_22826 [Forsythia ovata]|uniref:Uncharacterized protein n=1 Tax=Forsythia ovata TaxID=205694 RepID=A0ABD1V0M6_9LAMI